MNPRLRLATLPTPIKFLPHLSAKLNGVHVWVKRDDLTGIAFGGNKIRKLEFILADALAHGAKTLITVGAAQSNHCRLTAALAARLGLDCILVLSGDPSAPRGGNLLLDELLGAEIVWTTKTDRDSTLHKKFAEAWEDGRRPHLIPLGASTSVGTLGYADAFQEFLTQNVDVDWILIASSSGGTQAGLALGAYLSNWNGKILGISIDQKEEDLKKRVADLATEAAERLGKKATVSPDEIHVNADYLGEGYGVLGAIEKNAIRRFAQDEGLFLDPVYTGRAGAGLIDLVNKGTIKPGERVLFWHTGGTPALFAPAYQNLLLNKNQG